MIRLWIPHTKNINDSLKRMILQLVISQRYRSAEWVGYRQARYRWRRHHVRHTVVRHGCLAFPVHRLLVQLLRLGLFEFIATKEQSNP